MGAEQGSLLHSYMNGEEVDVAKLRIHLRQTSAADRWSALKTERTAICIAARYNDVATAKYMLDGLEPGQVYEMLKMTGSFEGIESSPLHIAVVKDHRRVVNFIINSLPERKLDLLKLQNKEGETPLHAAVKSHEIETLELLLSTLTEDQRYEVLNVRNKRNETVLHTAIHSGKSSTVETILQSVPNMKLDLPESLDSRGAYIVLHAAVGINNMKMVQLVLSPLTEDQRYEVLVQDFCRVRPYQNRVRHSLHESYPVLHVAAYKGHTNIVRCILESVPNKQLDLLKLQHRKEETVLHAAVDANNNKMVELILSHLTEDQRYEVLVQESYLGTVLHVAASKGHTNILKYILESVPSKACDLLKIQGIECTVLHVAVNKNNMEMVQLILSTLTEDQRYEVLNVKNREGKTMLHMAAYEGHIDIVKCIIKSVPNKRLDLSELQHRSAHTVLHAAVDANNAEIVQTALSTLKEYQRYGEMTRWGQWLQLSEAPRGHTDIVEWILEPIPNRRLYFRKLLIREDVAGRDMLQDRKGGSTVLQAAVNANNVEIVLLILSNLTENQRYTVLKEMNNQGEAVLHTAASKDHPDILKFILESVPNTRLDLLKLQDRKQETVLQAAVDANKMEMVQCILSALSEQQRYEILKQQSVLHIAASKGHTNTVKCILESIPNKKLNLLKTQNEKGGTVLHAAMDANMVEMVQVILSTLSEDWRYNALNAANRQGVTVLHTAATEGRTNIVKSILESVPNKMLDLLKLRYGKERNTPLHTAAIEKKSETVLTILQVVTPDGLKELQDIKNNQNQSIADLAAPELYYHYTTQDFTALKEKQVLQETTVKRQAEELAVLKGRSVQKDTVIAAQAKELRSTRQEVTELRESYVQQETVITRQDEELRNTGREMAELRESYVQQTGELQQIRHNQTEMLRMIEALEISLGKPTSDQENETDNDN